MIYKLLLIGLVIGVLIPVGSYVNYKNSLGSFDCDRLTADYRQTDKYCDSFSTYLKDVVSFSLERTR